MHYKDEELNQRDQNNSSDLLVFDDTGTEGRREEAGMASVPHLKCLGRLKKCVNNFSV